MSEHEEQALFFSWLDTQLNEYPQLVLFHAIPNGGKLPYTRDRAGRVVSKQRIYLVNEGMMKGVPDTYLPLPTLSYHGLYIEFKFGSNKPTPDQDIILKCLALLGYRVHVCYTFEAAQQATLEYLKNWRVVVNGAPCVTWHKKGDIVNVPVNESLFTLLERLRK